MLRRHSRLFAQLVKADLARDLDLTFLTLEAGIDPVASIAELSEVDDSEIPEGSTKVVLTLDDAFKLERTDGLVPDNITTVAAKSGNGAWVRLGLRSMKWARQAHWYIDPTNGDDEGAGTETAPLKTPDELSRRLASAPKYAPLAGGATVMVWVMGTLTERFRFNDLPVGTLLIMRPHASALTVLGTGTLTADQAENASAGGTTLGSGNHMEIEASGLAASWTASGYVYKAIRITKASSPAFGAVGFIAVDLGTANKRARCTLFSKTPEAGLGTFATPQVGDTFEILDLPAIPQPAINNVGGFRSSLGMYMLSCLGDWDYELGAGITGHVACACAFPPPPGGGGAINITPGGQLNLYGCLSWGDPNTGDVMEFDVWNHAIFASYGSAFVSGYCTIYAYGEQSDIWLYKNTLLQSGAQLFVSGTLAMHVNVFLSDLAVFDNAIIAAVSVGAAGTMFVVQNGPTFGGYVYGTNNAFAIFKLGSFSKATYGTKANLKAAMTGGAKPILFGALAKDFADLPFINTATAADNQSAFVAI